MPKTLEDEKQNELLATVAPKKTAPPRDVAVPRDDGVASEALLEGAAPRLKRFAAGAVVREAPEHAGRRVRQRARRDRVEGAKLGGPH